MNVKELNYTILKNYKTYKNHLSFTKTKQNNESFQTDRI